MGLILCLLLVGVLVVGFLVGRVRRRDVGLILCLAARRTSCERPTERPMTRAAVTRITAPPIFKSFVRKTIVESPLCFICVLLIFLEEWRILFIYAAVIFNRTRSCGYGAGSTRRRKEFSTDRPPTIEQH